jgi:hypothetical protein
MVDKQDETGLFGGARSDLPAAALRARPVGMHGRRRAATSLPM